MSFENFFSKKKEEEVSDIPEQSGSPVSPSRRSFLKAMSATVAAVTLGLPEGSSVNEDPLRMASQNELPEDYWFKVISDIYKEYGTVSPLQIRAMALIDSLEISSGQTSAIGVDENGERENVEKDAVIAKYLTNSAGVWIRGTYVTTSDFRALYPEGLPLELRAVLDPRTLAIMDADYNHRQTVEDTRLSDDVTNVYVRLPGGVDVFLKGCIHSHEWMSVHGESLAEMAKYAEVVAIEGYANLPLGESLKERFHKQGDPNKEHYSLVMKEIAKKGFRGLFSEVDARNVGIVHFDSEGELDSEGNYKRSFFPDLPDSFFQDYFVYIQETQPGLIKKISSPDKLKRVLIDMSTSDQYLGINQAKLNNVEYSNVIYTLLSEKIASGVPTGLEFGQKLFSDALAAIKLNLIAKLMVDGKITKGPILDFEGAGHVSDKAFFLRYPQYAAEIVLRSVHELTAGDAVRQETNSATAGAHAEKVFVSPDWTNIVRKIGDLPFAKVIKVDDSQTIESGENQMPIVSQMYNFWDLYGIDPATIVPNDEQIKEMMDKFENQDK